MTTGQQEPAPHETAALVRPDELSFTVVSTGDGQPLAKRFSLNDQGQLETSTAATLVEGNATVERVSSISEFAARLYRLDTHQAVLFGIPPIPTAKIVTQRQYGQLTLDQRAGVITRAREHIQFAHAPGVAMMDFDTAGAPHELLQDVESAERTRQLLIKAAPELESAPMLWRPSSSSYLYRGATEIQGLRGQRIYIPVARASDIPILGELLYERLWLLGYGYVLVSKSGHLWTEPRWTDRSGSQSVSTLPRARSAWRPSNDARRRERSGTLTHRSSMYSGCPHSRPKSVG